ncbi:hypothetical protein NLJ89_g3178 [Agrocybe chaxingu]|uniref:Uncharacterized protein n=1 Tax=Agrocybe chaxingu TaxID=84603 RepID=A0A9W8K5T4_9AGAR|nr:hypothetical protein NLJ89_g3178 [Agrocybe chaxingu]
MTSWTAFLHLLAQLSLCRICERLRIEDHVAEVETFHDLLLHEKVTNAIKHAEECNTLVAACEAKVRRLAASQAATDAQLLREVMMFAYQPYIDLANPLRATTLKLRELQSVIYGHVGDLKKELAVLEEVLDNEHRMQEDEKNHLRESLEIADEDLGFCKEERNIAHQTRMEDATRLTDAIERIKVLDEDLTACEADLLSERETRADDAIWFEYQQERMRGEYAELSERHSEALAILKEWEHKTTECEAEWGQRHKQTEGRLADALERITDLERVAAENDMNVALERGSWMAKTRAAEEKIQEMMAIQTTLEQHSQRLQDDMTGKFWRTAASRNSSGVADEDTRANYIRERATRDLERQTHEETGARLAAALERIEALERAGAAYESKMVNDRIKWSERGQRDTNKLAELESANAYFVKLVQDAVAGGLFEETELAIRERDAEELDVERRLRGEINGYRKVVEELQGTNLELKKSASQARAEESQVALMTCCLCTPPEVRNAKASGDVPDGSGVPGVPGAPDEVRYKADNGSGIKDEMKLLAVRLLRPKKPSRMRDTGTSTDVKTSEEDSPIPVT